MRILQRFARLERYWDAEDDRMRAEIVLSPPDGVKVGFFSADGK